MYQIAIDGTSGSGKSSFAKGLAKAFGFYYLNTGEIYRALACAYKQGGYAEVNEENITAFVEDIEVKVDFEEGKQVVYVNGNSYTPYLRLEEISALTSQVAPFKILRARVLDVQRNFAKENNVVMEGRDIGSTVLPNADVKIFLTADVRARAERRYKELSPEDKAKTTFEEVLKDLEERDYRDSHRAVAPLKVAEGAIVLDNSNLNLQETIDEGIKIIRQKIKM